MKTKAFSVVIVVLLLSAGWSVSHAQMTTAITPTTGTGNLGTTVNQSGNVFNITGGTRPGCPASCGTNLFHSFNQFSVGVQSGVNDIANFQNTQINGSFPSTSNIFSRVTGGQRSNIFGTIQTTDFGSANLYLINPAGVLFGSTASLNVQGSFHVSTADYIRFNDPSQLDVNKPRFYADPAKSSILTSFSPDAFGFLNPNPAAIVVQGSNLQVPQGQSLSFVGGDLTITSDPATGPTSTLMAPSGQINLVSAASAGEAVLATAPNAPAFDVSSFSKLGQVRIDGHSSVNVSGIGSGTVFIRAGQFTLDSAAVPDDTAIRAYNFGDVDGARVAVDLQADDVLFTNTGSIKVRAFGAGRTGDLSVTADTMELDHGSYMYERTYANATAGDVVVNVRRLALNDGSQLFSEHLSLGRGGNLRLNVDTLSTNVREHDPRADHPLATITTQSFAWNTDPEVPNGKAGDITITAKGPITLNNTTIQSYGWGNGQAGSISLTSGPGPGSQIVLNQSPILTWVNSLGPGEVFRTPPRVTLTTDTITMTGSYFVGGGIYTTSFGTAPAADIVVNVGTLRSYPTPENGFNYVRIFSSNSGPSSSAGPAGNITIKGPDPNNPNDAATLIDFTGGAIGSQAFGLSPGASAGNVTITADTVRLTRMGLATYNDGNIVPVGQGVYSEADSLGPAGNITFNVRRLLSNVAGDGTLLPASGKDLIPMPQDIAEFDNLPPGTWVDQNIISSRSNGQFISGDKNSNTHDPTVGRPGTVIIKGPDPTNPNDAATLVALNNTLIGTTMSGGTPDTPPGHITISSDTLSLTNGTQILADTSGATPAGNITFNVGTLTSNIQPHGLGKPLLDANGHLVPLNDAAPVLIKSTSTGEGRAGAIAIRGIASTDAASTSAGQVTLNNTTVSTTVNDAVSSSASPARITITADTINLSNGTQITADTSGAALAGDITLTATDTLSLAGGSSLLASTHSSGNAGQVLVTTPTLTMDNGHIETNTEGTGDAGTVTLNTNQLMMQSGSQITTSTSGVGNAGSVTVQGQHSPADSVTIDGAGSGIFTDTQGTGAGGNINIFAQSFTLQNGGTLSATTSSSGNAGSITANVGAATLTNNAKISSSSTGSSASDPLQPFGNAGTVSLNVSGTFQSSNSSVTTSVQQGKGTTGTPSTITITAGQDLNLTSETTVSTLSDGLKTDAGAITLTAGNTLVLSDSHVTSKASNPDIANNPALAPDYTASGGDIKLTAPNMIRLVNGEVVASVQGNVTTSGGNINIDPQFVILQNSKILANAFAGTGGNITITAGVYLADASSKVDASSTKGINGSVDIQTPVTNLSGTLAPLPGEIVQVTGLLQARCAVRFAGGTASSFVVAGRDGLPLEPGGLLPSPLYVESERSTRLAKSLGLPALHVGRSFMESNLTLAPLALGCSS